ncbi:putative ABC transport system permease protein [Granulicella rosea]|uniref:Putative ABC transport system permease protein n=1 Tax=Granulicella rosea TaxID=474952 RepID=A0A239IZH4_9BACT|nr:ABC transporter permease [Granulicella rosea]SNS97814.1 putative ABC transport system permease protein [Granulicella rosea]
MFLRLLYESFARQRRRKLLAGLAILLGTTAVTAMLALATTIGDRIHQELAVYGANIVVTPKADQLAVKIGGVDIKPATGGAYLKESDLAKLKTIFWANNITGISPELPIKVDLSIYGGATANDLLGIGLWFDHPLTGGTMTGAPQLHPWWKIEGSWPKGPGQLVVGRALATKYNIHVPMRAGLAIPGAQNGIDDVVIYGILDSGDDSENKVFMTLNTAQNLNGTPDAISRVDISAQTKPEDAFARQDPDTLTPAKREIWYCRPYANSIAYQIREAIPGADAQQVRKVEQSEGTVLERISGLMWLISAAALLAAGFAVSAAMATAVLERRGEIGLMRSLGASRTAIALLFYAENGLLAIVAGAIGYLAGSALAYTLGAHIFSGVSTTHALNPVLLPIVVALALIVAIAGSTPSIRAALKQDPSAILRGDA